MLTCRSISAANWEHARQTLVFYFSRRHQRADAEDLAHDTLAALWDRNTYEFEREEDFLRVCFGFARQVMKAGFRKALKHAGEELDEQSAAPPGANAFGLNHAEMAVFLREVVEVGKSELRREDWDAIRIGSEPARPGAAAEIGDGDANRGRVRLHRARRKLARLAGWIQMLL